MKKLVFHLRLNSAIDFIGSDHSVRLMLKQIDANEEGVDWEVWVTEDSLTKTLKKSQHGESVPLHSAWEESYLAMCSPVVLYVKGKDYCPEFVVVVPDDVTLRVVPNGKPHTRPFRSAPT